MDKFLKAGLALAGFTTAAFVTWRLIQADEAQKASEATPADSKPQKELTRLREQRKSSSTISQPDTAQHDVYRLFGQFAAAFAPLSDRYNQINIELDAFPMDLDEIVLYPEDLLAYVEKDVVTEGRPTLYMFTTPDIATPAMILTLDGECYVMGFTHAERFIASGPEFKDASTIGYLEAVLETLID